jgi:hypothetical protein
LRVKVPAGRLPDVARTLRLIPEKFEEVELRLEVIAHGGKHHQTAFAEHHRGGIEAGRM